MFSQGLEGREENAKEEPPERIAQRAFRYQGEVFAGNTHNNAYELLQQRFPDVDVLPLPEYEKARGYLTDRGRFVTELEAREVQERYRSWKFAQTRS